MRESEDIAARIAREQETFELYPVDETFHML